MAPVFDVPTVRLSVLPVIASLVVDRIPNIRFNVAKALEVLSTGLSGQPGGKELVAEGILPALEKLRGDTDADVRFFAEKGTVTAQGVVNGSGTGELKEVVMSDA